MGYKNKAKEVIAFALGVSTVSPDALSAEKPFTEEYGKSEAVNATNSIKHPGLKSPPLEYGNTIAELVKPGDLVAENQDSKEEVKLLYTVVVKQKDGEPTVIKFRGPSLPPGYDKQTFENVLLYGLQSRGFEITNEKAKSTTVLDIHVNQEYIRFLNNVTDIQKLNKRLVSRMKDGARNAGLELGINVLSIFIGKLPWVLRQPVWEAARPTIGEIANENARQAQKTWEESNPIQVAKDYELQYFGWLKSSLNSNEEPSKVTVFLQVARSKDGTYWFTDLFCKDVAGKVLFKLQEPLPLVTKIEPTDVMISEYMKVIMSGASTLIDTTWDGVKGVQSESAGTIQVPTKQEPPKYKLPVDKQPPWNTYNPTGKKSRTRN